MHAVEDAQWEAEVHDGKPGGVAIERLLQPVLKHGVSPKRGHDPQLKRCKENKTATHTSGDGKLSSCSVISVLAQGIVGILQE